MPQTSGIIAGLGRVRLTLEPTPQPSEIGGSILATAILTKDERGREQEPLSGQTIVFWLGPDEVYSHPTDDHGRESYTFAGLGFGTHAISVQCGGISVTHRHTFERKVLELVATNFHAEGDEGDYTISGSLAYKAGRPASGIPVRFLVSRLGHPGAQVHDDATDGNGFVSFPISFMEPEADVTVQWPGGEKQLPNLYGPSRHPRLTEADLEPRPGDLDGNIFRVIWRALWRS
jgi:hypothetical protein